MEHDCIACDDDDDDMFVETRLNFVLSSFKWKWIHFISFHLCHCWLEHVCIPLCVCVSISVFMFDYIFIRYGVVSRELFAICSLMISQRNTIHFPSCHSVSGMANKEHLLKEYCVCLLYFFFYFLIRKWNQKLLPFQMAICWSAAFISIYLTLISVNGSSNAFVWNRAPDVFHLLNWPVDHRAYHPLF